MKKHYRSENNCLNCGTILDGKYCHNCGQENLEIKENFGHLMNHAISDYFHFDHQFFHTLKPLLFKPGHLTNEYMAGKRAQYLHPIKMYIFISLVFFVMLFKKSGDDKEQAIQHKKVTNKEIAATKKSLDSAKVLSDGQKTMIINAMKKQASADSLKEKQKRARKDGEDDVDVNDNDDSGHFFGLANIGDTDFKTYADYEAEQKKLRADERDGFFKRQFERKAFSYKKYGSEAKEIFLEDIKHNIPKMMFVLLPLFALILRLAFWKNHKYYVEHLIFSFHLHCFVFLLWLIAIQFNWILPETWGLSGWINTIVFFWVVYYIFKAFKVVYHRSNGRTISKMFGISFVYLIAFSFCMLGLVVLTALV
ncbi:DUF3667 domain-containing protein [Mucilaginibacter ginkgonis]|uniref:DUF3667 domain-containing protein n=1 Tax=Mucilaginibacter ginkgonis TaxID=2682091 RepID=A0A6I4I177_9SPHI|nr:DUF3667 domain-containing protein [Mucilaginibacter ginkgonis]QQL51319.1 DUF3667 domain-containing protein [Mucilaginibacter ginkgonis]